MKLYYLIFRLIMSCTIYDFIFAVKSATKKSDFQANYELYYEFLFAFKGEAKKIRFSGQLKKSTNRCSHTFQIW